MRKIKLKKISYKYSGGTHENHYRLIVKFDCTMYLRERIAKEAKITLWEVDTENFERIMTFFVLDDPKETYKILMNLFNNEDTAKRWKFEHEKLLKESE